MMRRGGWREAAMTQGDTRTLIGVATLGAAGRVLDYATGDDSAVKGRVVAETLMPLTWWAAAMATLLAILILGWAQRRHLLVFVGHAGLAILYWSLGLGLSGAYIGEVIDLGGSLRSLNGSRSIGPLLVVATLHLIMAIRTGWRPLPNHSEVPDEAVWKAGGTS